MNITRAAAMRSVSRHVSYSDTVIDPAWLDLDEDAISVNQDLVRKFVARLEDRRDPKAANMFSGVPLAEVRGLLTTFRFHSQERRVDLPSLQRYLEAERDGLACWNVILKSVDTSSAPVNLGGPDGWVTPVTRAQVRGTNGYIRSLVDSSDHRVDVGGQPPSGHARYRASDEPPLLTLYAIDPTSKPQRKGNREPLNATSPPVSLSLAFPESDSTVDYVSPAINAIEPIPSEMDLGDHYDG